MTSIPDNAFGGCTSLKSITIPSSVTSIGRAAFQGCSALTSITIPSSVTSIGPDAFANCTSLNTIFFDNCTDLTLGIKLPLLTKDVITKKLIHY